MLKRFVAGFVSGAALATSVAAAAADQPIRLFVNGREIAFPEASPQIINGRVMVPARPLAEALGATVEWDASTNSVRVTTQAPMPSEVGTPTGPEAPPSSEWISLRDLVRQVGQQWMAGVEFPRIIYQRPGTIATVSINGKPVRVQEHESRTYLHRGDLRDAGLLP